MNYIKRTAVRNDCNLCFDHYNCHGGSSEHYVPLSAELRERTGMR